MLKPKLASKYQSAILVVVSLALGISARASTIPVTFLGANTGVNNGTDFVLPYQLNVNGTLFDATCYDIFDEVSTGETWNADELTVDQAAATGQFSSDPDALNKYKEIGFLSQQVTNSAQDQIDLQEDVWNVFAPGRYEVTAGMQSYMNLLTPSAFTTFDFSTVLFLEDANPTESSRVQSFVIDPPTSAPEPATVVLIGSGVLLIGIGKIRKRKVLSEN
jgi:hypothetical protein